MLLSSSTKYPFLVCWWRSCPFLCTWTRTVPLSHSNHTTGVNNSSFTVQHLQSTHKWLWQTRDELSATTGCHREEHIAGKIVAYAIYCSLCFKSGTPNLFLYTVTQGIRLLNYTGTCTKAASCDILIFELSKIPVTADISGTNLSSGRNTSRLS